MSGRQERADAALAALQADGQARRAERDRADGEPRATVRRLLEDVQRAAHNGDTEAERVASEALERLVALIEPRPAVEEPELEGQPGASHLVHSVVSDAVAALQAVSDPTSRAFAAEDAIEAAAYLRGQLAEVRRDAVREMRGPGRPPKRTWEEIGEALGVTGARAQAIAKMAADRNAPRGPRAQGANERLAAAVDEHTEKLKALGERAGFAPIVDRWD